MWKSKLYCVMWEYNNNICPNWKAKQNQAKKNKTEQENFERNEVTQHKSVLEVLHIQHGSKVSNSESQIFD